AFPGRRPGCDLIAGCVVLRAMGRSVPRAGSTAAKSETRSIMKRSWMRGAAALFAMTAIVAACDDDPAGNGGDPRVSILLTDAPGDVAEARIVIDEIAIMGDADESAVVLSTDDWEGDLLDLRNTFATLVDEVAVPVGSYHQ